jgi:hypothetical protein
MTNKGTKPKNRENGSRERKYVTVLNRQETKGKSDGKKRVRGSRTFPGTKANLRVLPKNDRWCVVRVPSLMERGRITERRSLLSKGIRAEE